MTTILPETFELGAHADVKRTICKFFVEGNCDKGELCGFAHNESEIGQPINSVKRTLCKFWLDDHCERDMHCTFAHGEHEIGFPIIPAPQAELSPQMRPDSDLKRSVCKFWEEGKCQRGDACGFAHGVDQIGQPIVGQLLPPIVDTMRTLCKFFQEGSCEKGGNCSFAHGEEELGLPIREQVGAPARPRPTAAAAPVKTKMTVCKFWLDGACEKGKGCTFAHGEQEVGLPIEPSFETKRTICKFWQDGTCDKGPEQCTFAHGEGEIGQPITSAPPLRNAKPITLPITAGIEKRTMCKFWQDNNCDKGKACGFAHGSHQLGQVTRPMINPIVKHMFESDVKRTICKFWQDGNCDKGNVCTFAHGARQIGKMITASIGKILAATLPPPAFKHHVSAKHVQHHGADEVKRTICKFWQEGKCEKDQSCTFAHGDHEIGQRASGGSQSRGGNVDVKRTICKFWQEGTCDKGAACTFAHGEAQIGQVAQIGKLRPQTYVSLPKSGPSGDLEVKRTICKFWQNGACEKDRACTFAHGEHQIGRVASTSRPGALPPSDVKRTICKFWQDGACDKGHSCTFAHGGHQIGKPAAQESTEVKRTICKFWEEQKCDKGDACTFAHGEQEIGCPVPGKRLTDYRDSHSKRQRVH